MEVYRLIVKNTSDVFLNNMSFDKGVMHEAFVGSSPDMRAHFSIQPFYIGIIMLTKLSTNFIGKLFGRATALNDDDGDSDGEHESEHENEENPPVTTTKAKRKARAKGTVVVPSGETKRRLEPTRTARSSRKKTKSAPPQSPVKTDSTMDVDPPELSVPDVSVSVSGPVQEDASADAPADASADSSARPPSPAQPPQTPRSDTMDVDAPEVSVPDVSVPDVSVPDVSGPDVSAPDVSGPVQEDASADDSADASARPPSPTQPPQTPTPGFDDDEALTSPPGKFTSYGRYSPFFDKSKGTPEPAPSKPQARPKPRPRTKHRRQGSS